MNEQLLLDFGRPDGWIPFPPAHPMVILRWDAESEMVCSEWPEFKLKAKFHDWALALEMVLHPNNAHVSLRIRT